MAFSIPTLSISRARGYIFRLPLFTRCILVICFVVWLLSFQSKWDIVQWGALIPNEVGLGSMYRINTYPFIHLNFLHGLLNLVVLTPLLERFEAEHGTLSTLAMFTGRESTSPTRLASFAGRANAETVWCSLAFSTFPAGMYILLEYGILRSNSPAMGVSTWIFILIASEAIRTYRVNPHFNLGPYKIPTWTTPFIFILLISFLVPSTSFVDHLCALAVGYVFGLGYLKFIAPPEKVLRWVEGKLNLLGRLPHYVSVDQMTYGRYGILPQTAAAEAGHSMNYTGSTQRLGA
ncbi:MAG: Bud site selection protein 20 [Chaenotheca gracillima]|nr:MAG: Bud site selection protein 20 [Chaenotheca gracillima]